MAAKKLKDEDIRYDVLIEWKDLDEFEVLEGVSGYRLENGFYYFFYSEEGVKTEEGETIPKFKTLWLQHPDLRSVTVTPYHQEKK